MEEKIHSKNTADCDDYSSLRGGGTPAFNPCSESGKKSFESLPPHVGLCLFLETGRKLKNLNNKVQ